MKISGISSATAPPARKSFTLTGRTVALDPRTHAVRRDIADIRLAEYVFAPHYARAVPQRVTIPVALRAGREEASETMAELEAGETFEILEIAGATAWGLAVAHGLVGYIDAAAFEAPFDTAAA